MTVLTLVLTHAEYRIYPEARLVETLFPKDGTRCCGTRADTKTNRDEAGDQGYTWDAEGVWQSLQDHELLHSLVSEWLWQGPSPALRHEAGAMRAAFGIRLYEESVVISFQRFLQAGEMWPALLPYAEQLTRWRARYQRTLENIREAAA